MKLLYGTGVVAEQLFRAGFEMNYVNLSSLKQGMRDLGLMPPNSLGAIGEYDFDLRYMAYVINDNNNFVRFFENIVLPLYRGQDVFIAASMVNEWEHMIIESLLKILQQRYGLNAYYVATPDDVPGIEDTDFTAYGLTYLDQDNLRYTSLASERYVNVNPDGARAMIMSEIGGGVCSQ